MFMSLGFEAKRLRMMLNFFFKKNLSLTCLYKILISLVGAKSTRHNLRKAKSKFKLILV